MHYLFRITSLITYLLILNACGGDKNNTERDIDICDFSSYPRFYNVVGISSRNIHPAENQTKTYRFQYEVLQANDRIDWESYAIRIDMKSKSQSLAQRQGSRSVRFSFFKRANACSPPIPELAGELVSINITSDGDFSPERPAGSSLNDIFRLHRMSNDASLYKPAVYNAETDAVITQPTLTEYNTHRGNNFSKDSLVPWWMVLQLTEEAAPESEHRFTVELSLNTGESFQTTTPGIQFGDGEEADNPDNNSANNPGEL